MKNQEKTHANTNYIYVEKAISFVNRSWDQLMSAFLKLKERYRTVEMHQTLKNGLYFGEFSVKTYKRRH